MDELIEGNRLPTTHQAYQKQRISMRNYGQITELSLQHEEQKRETDKCRQKAEDPEAQGGSEILLEVAKGSGSS